MEHPHDSHRAEGQSGNGTAHLGKAQTPAPHFPFSDSAGYLSLGALYAAGQRNEAMKRFIFAGFSKSLICTSRGTELVAFCVMKTPFYGGLKGLRLRGRTD